MVILYSLFDKIPTFFYLALILYKITLTVKLFADEHGIGTTSPCIDHHCSSMFFFIVKFT